MKTWVPIHALIRDYAMTIKHFEHDLITRICEGYCRGDRIVFVHHGEITYGDWVVECLIRRGYTEVLVEFE
jgi:hypothetical protein